jgi:ATP-binding cassette, subfamily F, member 3
LLKALGWGLVAALPRRLRCLYVDQLEGMGSSERSAAEIVAGADIEARRAEQEAAALQDALETGDAAAAATALRALQRGRLQDEVIAARRTAEVRSGERGLAARKVLVAAEARLAEATGHLDDPVKDDELAGSVEAAQVSEKETGFFFESSIYIYPFWCCLTSFFE